MLETLNPVIRRVQRDDYEGLVRFFKETNTDQVKRHFHPFALSEQTAHHIVCTDHLDVFYIAVSEKKIVGLFMLRGWDEGFEIPSFGVVVAGKYQGLGLGRLMTESAIGEAKKLGCRSLRLSVYASNHRAVALYESLGFFEVSRSECTVGAERDQRIVMSRMLSP